MKVIALLISTLIVSACGGTIQHKTNVAQSIGQMRTAGVGDVVLKATTEKSLPNAFGKADVFGRTTPTGMTTVTYMGLREGKAIFRRNSIDIETNATTMNSTPIIVPNTTTTRHSGTIDGMAYSGRSTTTGASTVIPANTPQAQYMERGVTEIVIDTNSLPAVFIADEITVRVVSADSGSVRYILEK